MWSKFFIREFLEVFYFPSDFLLLQQKIFERNFEKFQF